MKHISINNCDLYITPKEDNPSAFEPSFLRSLPSRDKQLKIVQGNTAISLEIGVYSALEIIDMLSSEFADEIAEIELARIEVDNE